jgi:hypothetical protein
MPFLSSFVENILLGMWGSSPNQVTVGGGFSLEHGSPPKVLVTMMFEHRAYWIWSSLRFNIG